MRISSSLIWPGVPDTQDTCGLQQKLQDLGGGRGDIAGEPISLLSLLCSSLLQVVGEQERVVLGRNDDRAPSVAGHEKGLCPMKYTMCGDGGI
jgi:hypothetical protein